MMQYEEKLLELMFDTDPQAVVKWIKTHPVLDQVDIYREYIVLLKRRLAQSGNTGKAGQEELYAAFEKQVDDYQETYLHAAVVQLECDLASERYGKALDAFDDAYTKFMNSIRSAVEANGPNVESLKATLRNIIAEQKKKGHYDPEDWYWLDEA